MAAAMHADAAITRKPWNVLSPVGEESEFKITIPAMNSDRANKARKEFKNLIFLIQINFCLLSNQNTSCLL